MDDVRRAAMFAGSLMVAAHVALVDGAAGLHRVALTPLRPVQPMLASAAVDIGEALGFHEATASRKIVRVQTEIRKLVEKNLREHHGWDEIEVKRNLSETAEKLGMNLEGLFGALMLFVLVQEFIGAIVHQSVC